HSLLAIRLLSALRKDLKVEIHIKDLFTRPTIKSLAAHIESQANTSLLPSIEIHPRPANIPLSFSQERLWFIDQLKGTTHYHIPHVFQFSGDVNIKALEIAFQAIVNR